MALITIVGFPCSGKSTRALELRDDFQTRLSAPGYSGPELRVVVVDDESNHVERSVYDSKLTVHIEAKGSAYNPDSIAEKSGRANIYSAVTRNLGPDTIVICDSPNYIKGFRYQMYCAAREAHARVCTVSSLRHKFVWNIADGVASYRNSP
jgi:protein KTI12